MKASSALLLIALLACPGIAYGQAQTHTLMIATDLHYIAPELTDHGAYFTRMIESADGKVMQYSEELCEAFTEQVIATQPDALILSGDLTFNGARASHESLAEKLSRIRTAGIPVYVIPGNHDLNSRSAASFSGEGYTLVESVSPGEFASIYGAFGFDAALSRDTASLSYTAEPFPGLRLLMLDANVPGMSGAIPDETLAWLIAQLEDAAACSARVISVSHQNLLAHNSLFTSGFVIANRDRLLPILERYGVGLNLSGHMHIQHIAASEAGLPEVATSSLAVSPCQYGVITLRGDEGTYETHAVDVSAWAAANGLQDENLLDFAAYAQSFFVDSSFAQTLSGLGDTQDAQALADYFARLNAAYFSGRTDLFQQDEALARQWQALPGFMSTYLGSILLDGARDHTHLTFSLRPAGKASP